MLEQSHTYIFDFVCTSRITYTSGGVVSRLVTIVSRTYHGSSCSFQATKMSSSGCRRSSKAAKVIQTVLAPFPREPPITSIPTSNLYQYPH